MANYRVSFYKNKMELNKETGKNEKVGQEYLGSITVDDNNTSNDLPVVAKAFRQASPVLQTADRTVVERV